ncbi:TFIIB-type zinc ribbon-containing protein [Isoptericola halotolerans]|uniref:TFIIB-type zinc ribbon-containing protein n=1 Tax=Isoptericola halotolerans TaxID=300560 RepID=UPI0038911320
MTGTGQADGAPRVIRTDAETADGLSKCSRCGATQIALNIGTGMLRCSFCRHEWSTPGANEAFGLDEGVGDLTGITMGSGSADLVPTAEVVLTFKCSACGAEIVVDTASSTQARCHWCRNKLSVNQQVPNGAVPDMVLPFSLPKEKAVEQIARFVRKRRFFAHPRFREEFNPENVLGAYLPYMVVDVNAHASFSGQGEHQTRRYSVKVSEDRSETRYDADLYDVGRDFDLEVHDLAVVSSRERLDQRSGTSNNVINAIRPFDLENAVTYDSNYLAGFTSERRDTDVADLAPIVDAQSTDVARHVADDTLGFYGRGVRWDDERLTVKGQRWVSAYLPVWLYSYHQTKRDGEPMVHYVAVNGRTGAVMGSVPINYPRLLLTSAAVEVLGIVVGTIVLALGALS